MDEQTLVDTDWLAEHLGKDGVVAVDVRSPHFYAQAHLPGAVNLPVFFLVGPNAGAPEGPLLARRLASLGIAKDSHVIAYDEGAGQAAARLYWVLRYYRHPLVSVLDGGITKWRHEGRDWEYTPSSVSPASYEIQDPDQSVRAILDEVKGAIGDEQKVILDVRSPAEYLGLQMTAGRSGHIPGAINIDWTNNYVEGSDGIVAARAEEELQTLFSDAGVDPSKEVIIYCHSGSRSAETFLALARLDYPNVRMYSEGWQEWGNRPDTPIEEG